MSVNNSQSNMMNPVQIDDVKLEEVDLSNKFEETTKVFISSDKNFKKPRTSNLNIKSTSNAFSEEAQQNDIQVLSYQSPQKPLQLKSHNSKNQLIGSNQELPDPKSLSIQKQFLFTQIKEHQTLNLTVEKVTGFFNIFMPYYQVFAQNSNEPLMNAKRISLNPNSTIVISTNKDDFDQKSQFYLGKIKSSVIGDKLNIFGPGLSPANALKQNVKPRQLLGTIVYSTRVSLNSLPRFFKVYLLRKNVDYYSAFQEVKMYGEQIPLNELYNNPSNRSKIFVLRSKEPKWCKEKNRHILNFGGKAKIACINNFILEEDILQQETSKINEGQNKLLFAKFQSSKFHLDVSCPLNPFLAFCIATSNLEGKMFCE